ncbi:MAG: MNIO family bufferin maturase [Sphingomonadaceae bacterium]
MPAHTTLPLEAGIGLKPEHYSSVLGAAEGGVLPGWVEVHPQNYFGDGGPPHRWLSAIAEILPLSFHSVGLSLGSAQGCDRDELERLARLTQRYQPVMVSDHLSWSMIDGEHYPDLLPIPYTYEALAHFEAEIARVQDRLRRPMLIENPSRYLAWNDDAMTEPEFLTALCRRAGCGLLFDINNVEVSANNVGFDAADYVDAIDPALVCEIHLAGHAVEMHPHGALMIDDHGSPVSDVTWNLYSRFIDRAGPRPTLIEWDTAVPTYERLTAEAAIAQAVLDQARHDHAHAT